MDEKQHHKKNDEKYSEQKNENSKRFEERYATIEQEIKDSKVSIDDLYSWFKKEIERKETEIRRLKTENDLLFNTAVKANAVKLDAHEHVHRDDKK